MRTPHLVAARCSLGDPEAPYRHGELAIWDAYQRSLAVDPRRWASAEEGAMLLGESIGAVWDAVRDNRIGLARAAAAQAGALGVRFVVDVCESSDDRVVCGRGVVRDAQQVRSFVGPGNRPLASSREGVGFVKREFDSLWSAVCDGEPPRERCVRLVGAATRLIAEIPDVAPSVVVAR